MTVAEIATVGGKLSWKDSKIHAKSIILIK